MGRSSGGAASTTPPRPLRRASRHEPMSKTQYYCAATLDGYIAEADDTLGWLMGYDGRFDGEGLEAGPLIDGGAYERFYDEVGALVSGSTTYEFLLNHINDDTGWPYKGKPYWVLSSRDLRVPEVEGVDVRVVDAAAEEVHADMLDAAGARNLWVVGGGNVASQFAGAG